MMYNKGSIDVKKGSIDVNGCNDFIVTDVLRFMVHTTATG